MSVNSFGKLFRYTSWGESHGPATGAVIDSCPPGIALSESDIQPWLDLPRPGLIPDTSPRNKPDEIRILAGIFEGRTTGTPISLPIENRDARPQDNAQAALIMVRAAFKPTSSIRRSIPTIDCSGEAMEISTAGRHDPCVGIRGAPVIEAMDALLLADHKLLHRAQCG